MFYQPIYKGNDLVGAIGDSGDGVEQNENAAAVGTVGFEPPSAIRIPGKRITRGCQVLGLKRKILG